MADNSVYRVTELIGVSSKSWEDATNNAIETASRSLEDLRIAEVVKLDVTIDKGKVTGYRLQSKTDLNAASWTDITTANNQFTETIVGTAKFYRLISP